MPHMYGFLYRKSVCVEKLSEVCKPVPKSMTDRGSEQVMA